MSEEETVKGTFVSLPPLPTEPDPEPLQDVIRVPQPPSGPLAEAPPDPSQAAGVYVHQACQSDAFLVTVIPAPGQSFSHAIIRRMDGTPLTKTDPVECEHCGTAFALRGLAARHVRAF